MDVDGEEEAGGSYSQVVRRRKRGPTVVLEAPAEEGKQVTREQVTKCLDPKAGEVRVRGLRKIGKDFVVELHAEEDLEKLRGNEALEGIGVKVDGAPKLRWPLVIIHDIDEEIEKDDLVEAIVKRNSGLLGTIEVDKAKQELIPEFARGRRDIPSRSWVVRVSPEMYKRVMRVERLYVGLRSCKVQEFNSVSRCYRCQGLGHIRKYCRDQERCAHCSEQHDVSKCKKKADPPNCINCQRYGLRERRHGSNWRECPSLAVYRRRTEMITDYGV